MGKLHSLSGSCSHGIRDTVGCEIETKLRWSYNLS